MVTPRTTDRRDAGDAPDRGALSEYHAKRRFDVTPEPAGDAAPAPAEPGWSFVVQKHAARRLHYDFRLELDGVLLSWAVPKGPSLEPGVRRLAARTEDHPLEYAGFEGVIPADEYGGGSVVVWDRGTWEPEGDPREAMKKGRLTFTLSGEKLRGRWHLVRTGKERGKEQWLLFKGKDEAARVGSDIVAERPESVVTGRTIEQVAEDKDRVWHSNRGENTGELMELVKQLPSKVPLTNLDKVLYPDLGLTKGAIIAYLAVVADWMLPHLAGRPLTLVRNPDGIQKKGFYQKHAGKGVPGSVKRISIAEEDGEAHDYMMVDDLPGVIALAQLGALELHVWGSHADKVERPDLIVFDLDPDVGLGWGEIVRTAQELRERLRGLGLESFVKTTGGKGLHVVVPIERRVDWDDFKAFTRAVAEQMEREHPERYTTNPLKAKRKGKIFVDYLRNTRGATAIAPYSMRARAGATVATPITWDELARGVDPTTFTVTSIPRRLGGLKKDPWADISTTKQSITAAARRKVGMPR
jgi:bifunctional non-homologous end joining protein LigD